MVPEIGEDAIREIFVGNYRLIYEVREDFIEPARAQITTFMSCAAELRVPLKVEVGIGKHWDEAH